MEVVSIILAAGKGKRMNSDLPKPMHKIAGKTLMNWLEDSLDELKVSKKLYVLGHQSEKLIKSIRTTDYVIQEPQLGTGHAVNLTKDKIKNHESIIIIAYADTPFVPSDKIKKMISQIKNGYDISILGFVASNPKGYGRVVKKGNEVIKIVEEVDIDEETKTGNILLAGTFNADTGAGLTFGIEDKNIFGSGNSLNSNFSLNSEDLKFSLNFYALHERLKQFF